MTIEAYVLQLFEACRQLILSSVLEIKINLHRLLTDTDTFSMHRCDDLFEGKKYILFMLFCQGSNSLKNN